MNGDENVGLPEIDTVSRQEAQAELDRLMVDPLFHSTDRNRNFLRFVANEFFEGRSGAVKAYTIAVDVFGRPCSFDPTTDPIVRIEATRLRASLAQYYESRTEEGGVRIELPRGRYIPVFTKAPLLPEPTGDDMVECDPPVSRKSLWKARQFLARHGKASGVGLAALAALGSLWFILGREPVVSDKPSVAVELMFDGADGEGKLLYDHLMIALSQFQTLRLAAGDKPVAADTFSSGLIPFPATRHLANNYHIVLKYHLAEGERSVWWQIVNPLTGEALQAGIERAPVGTRTNADARQQLVTGLANRFASFRGVINTIELEHELANPTLGNGCVLRSAAALERPDAEGLRKAGDCLSATLAALPNDADANAQLALVLLGADPLKAPAQSTAQALELAEKAVAMAPMSDRAEYARMMALFRGGQMAAAFTSGYRAMALNPNSSMIPARLGLLLFAQGRWAEASGLAVKAGMIEKDPRIDAELTLALDAYRRGEFAEALLRMQQMGSSQDYVANVLELAAAGQLGMEPALPGFKDGLKTESDRFRHTFRSDMLALRYSQPMIDSLDEGLKKAQSLGTGADSRASILPAISSAN